MPCGKRKQPASIHAEDIYGAQPPRPDECAAGISEDDDVEVPAPTRSAPVVFASMQEVESFWDQQAHYVSNVCSVDVAMARGLLREHHHDVDAAIQGFLMNVRPHQRLRQLQ